MGKKKHNSSLIDGEPVLVEATERAVVGATYVTPVTMPADEADVRWGYGFEPWPGNKWRAYRTGAELKYLSPVGERLDTAVSRIRTALSEDVANSLRAVSRGVGSRRAP